MPTFDLGDHLFGDEMYWLLGGDEFRAPTIRELSLARRNYFAIDGGPAGYVQFADPNSVGFSSAFFDEASPQYLAHQRSVLEQEEWGGLEDSIPRVLQMLPRIRRFYERAWTSGYWVVHYGYVTEVEPPPTELRIEPLPRRGAVPAAWPVRRQGTR